MNDFLWRRLVEDLIELLPVHMQHVYAARIRSTVEGYRKTISLYSRETTRGFQSSSSARKATRRVDRKAKKKAQPETHCSS